MASPKTGSRGQRLPARLRPSEGEGPDPQAG
jgi:hypothetical protein